VQELLGHRTVAAMQIWQIYTHVLNRNAEGIFNQLDRWMGLTADPT